jgi:hypothetical protein
MADFSNIIQEINDDINTNGVGAITGAKLNEVLRDMIAAVNAEKQDPLTIDAAPTEDSTNPVQSGGVYEALGNLYTALAVAKNCLFGGFVEPNDEPIYGDDHRYYYLAATEGRYTHFYNFEVDSYIAMFLWNENTQHWRMLTLWPNDQTVTEWLENKANIVYNATAGHLAGLDEYGNPTDSGIAASDVATTSDLAGKQDTISDLATIRSGAAAGATAYQKPSGGIPKTDLASGVQTSLGKADTAFQKPSGGIPASDLSTAVQTSLGKADTAVQTETDPIFSASPAAGITSGDISDWDAKADPIPVVDASTIPASMDADKVYQYGTLSGDTTFPALNTPTDLTVAHVYCWTFTTPATAPTITWPSAITSWAGGSAPTINASKSYEVSVMDGFATIIEN